MADNKSVLLCAYGFRDTVRNAIALFQVLDFTGLLQVINKLQQAVDFVRLQNVC